MPTATIIILMNKGTYRHTHSNRSAHVHSEKIVYLCKKRIKIKYEKILFIS